MTTSTTGSPARAGVDVVRVGHPARVTPAPRGHTLDAHAREHGDWRRSCELAAEGCGYDVVVVDEATQATAPSALVPLTAADRVVLVGDHRQLPPTVLSAEAERRGLGRSLFERLAERHDEVLEMLTVQYRMHEKIMEYSSRRFYDGRLRAAPEVRTNDLRDEAGTRTAA